MGKIRLGSSYPTIRVTGIITRTEFFAAQDWTETDTTKVFFLNGSVYRLIGNWRLGWGLTTLRLRQVAEPNDWGIVHHEVV